MRLPWQRQPERDKQLVEAETTLRQLRERADQVMPRIERRARENHWTEVVQRIAQGGHTHG